METCCLLYLVQIEGWDGLTRIEETKLVCAISKKFAFGRKAEFIGIGDPKMVLKLIQNGPKWSPPPHPTHTPIPIALRQQKAPARGQTN